MDLTPLISIVLVAAFLIMITRWHYRRSAAILQKWADDNGYQIVEKELRHFFKGPFFFTASKHQTVYRVTVCDEAGQERSGWVVCGGWWLGMWTDHAKVRWDEVPQPERWEKAPQVAESPMRDPWLDGWR
jgi:hypothetical protein